MAPPLPARALAAVLLAACAAAASAQRDVSVPLAPSGVPTVVPGAALGPPAPAGSSRWLTPAALRLRSAVESLRALGLDGQKAFQDRLYDDLRSQDAPSAPVAGAPKAALIRFKDLVIPRAAFSEKTQISRILTDLIDRADSTLDLALHGLSLPGVADALLRAREERGVNIRILMNHSHAFPEREGQRVSAEVQFLMDHKFDMRTLRGGGPGGVMHNKIAIVDRKVLKLGSFNWTKAADAKNYENAVFFDDAGKIARYQRRFEKLWGEARPVAPGAWTAWPLAPESMAAYASEETVEFNGERFSEEMFSPKGGVEAALVRAIAAARGEIAVAMFSLTSDPVVTALIEARRRGVPVVRIVVDRSQAVGRGMAPDVRRLLDAGVDVVWTSGHKPGGVMHHKFAVFDRKMLEVGSFNWTNNAEHNNHENANFTLEAHLVQDFQTEFEEIYNGGTRPTDAEAAVIEALAQAGFFDPYRPAASMDAPR